MKFGLNNKTIGMTKEAQQINEWSLCNNNYYTLIF